MVAVLKIKLTIELVPKTCWFSNIRSAVSEGRWKVLQGIFFKRAGYVCEVCKQRGRHWPVELHERWLYIEDGEQRTQRLAGLQALCPACHEVKHIGLAQINGNGERAREHLMKINGWRKIQAEDYIASAMQRWITRSRHPWAFDLSWLYRYVPRSAIDETRAPNHVADFEEDHALEKLT